MSLLPGSTARGASGHPNPIATTIHTVTYPDATEDSFQNRWDKYWNLMREVRNKKHNDYVGASKDNLHNYKRSGTILAECLGLPGTDPNHAARAVMLARIFEKGTRVAVMLGGTKRLVADESTVDSLVDIANIALLIAASFEEEV